METATTAEAATVDSSTSVAMEPAAVGPAPAMQPAPAESPTSATMETATESAASSPMETASAVTAPALSENRNRYDAESCENRDCDKGSNKSSEFRHKPNPFPAWPPIISIEEVAWRSGIVLVGFPR